MASRLISVSLSDGAPNKGPAVTNWEAECVRLQVECARMKAMLVDTEEAAALALERQVAAAVERARAEFAGTTAITAEEQTRLEAENASLKELLADTEQAAALALERQLATAVERARREFADEQARIRAEFAEERETLSAQYREAIETATQARAELETMNRDWQSIRLQFSEEQAQLRAELERMRAEDECLRNERAALETRLITTQQELQVLTQRSPIPETAPNQGTGGIGELIHSEVARIEARIQRMLDLTANPEAELSDIVRQNVERAQMESYLSGLRFALEGSSSFYIEEPRTSNSVSSQPEIV